MLLFPERNKAFGRYFGSEKKTDQDKENERKDSRSKKNFTAIKKNEQNISQIIKGVSKGNMLIIKEG